EKIVNATSESTQASSPLRDRRLLGLLPLLGAMGLAYQGIFRSHPFEIRSDERVSEAEQFFFSPLANDSAFIIFALTAWLAARRCPRLFETLGRTDALILGSLGSAFAWTTLLWADYTSSPGLATASLSVFLIAGGGLLAGRAGARSMLLPAVFMALLAIPLSPVLVNAMIFSLQLWTAEVTTALLNLGGVKAFQAGDLILTREATFQVIETCSGFRITHTLIMSAIVYAEIFHRSRRRLALLLLAAPVIGLFVNLIRVITLVLNPKVGVASIHTAQGIVMLVVGVLLLALLDRLFQIGWPDPAHPIRSSDRVPEAQESWMLPRGRVLTLTGGLLVVFFAHLLITPWSLPARKANLIASMPRSIGPWETNNEVSALDPSYLGSTGFSSRILRKYAGPDGSEVELFVGQNDRSGRAMSLVSPKTKTLKAGFYVVEESTLTGDTGSDAVSEIIARDAHGHYWLIHHWYRNVESLPWETARRLLSLERSSLRRPEPALVVRVATLTDPDPGNRRADRERLEAFKAVALETLNEH
ncbi:MAG: EpsI family protein, partial [Myxococcota bacterium]|nr:EpsI family protein [Myxococcota bacterium]